jgi:hypothetical protein
MNQTLAKYEDVKNKRLGINQKEPKEIKATIPGFRVAIQTCRLRK